MDRDVSYVFVSLTQHDSTAFHTVALHRYEECMAALKVTKKKIAEEEAADRERRRKEAVGSAPVQPVKQSAKKQRIAELVGDVSVAVAPTQKGDYGMVPAHLRQDKRSLEEVERDMRAKRARKEKAAEEEQETS